MTQTIGDKKVFFHVGLGKVASTFLQYAVFPKFQGIQYIQRTRYKNAAHIINSSSNQTFLVSREMDHQLERETKHFSQSFPDAFPIIILRRHDSWIASQYRRYVKNGGYRSFRQFFDTEADEGLWKQSDLFYLPKLQVLQECFSQPPLVLFYDDLQASPFSFIDKLANYVGANYDKAEINTGTVHRSYSEKQLKVMRRLASYFFQEPKGGSHHGVAHWIARRSKMLACYSILYPALLVPDKWLNTKSLISSEELEAVRKLYEQDWGSCKEFSKKQ